MTSSSVTGLRAYRDLLSEPALRKLAVASVTARLATSMWSVVLFLAVADRRDESSAAVAVAAYTLGQAITAPVRGRWVDRRGARRVLPMTTVAHVLTLAVLVVTMGYSPLLVVGVAAVVAGALTPPVVATIRGLWIALTPPGTHRQTAMALDAVLLEVAFVAGPAAAGLLATLTDPGYAVLPVVALLVLSMVAVLRAEPSNQTAAGGGSGVWNPLARPDFTAILLVALAPTAAIAGVEVLLLTISHTGGYDWAGGVLLALMAVGSLLGGLLFGAYGSQRPAKAWFPAILLLMAVSIPLLLLGQAAPWTFVVVAPLVGATTAPSLACVFSLSAAATPAGKHTEAQSWVNTSLTAGFAVGAFVVAPFTQQTGVAVGVLVAITVVGALAARMTSPALAEPVPDA